MSKFDEVKTAVENGKTKIVADLVQGALDEGKPAKEILAGMIEAMGVVGDKFSAGEIFVPEMLVAARAMSKGVGVLKPLL
ncbi:MAG: cobalamin-binding protein, partial [Eubacteriaceae bacterium]|nr:cobalamin-binding protein [Eubacteriaceae bacterium]